MTDEERKKKLAEFFGVSVKIIDVWIETIYSRVQTLWEAWTQDGQTEEINLAFNSEMQYFPPGVCFNYLKIFPSYADIFEEIKLEEPKKILDYGCGTAQFSLYFAERYNTFVTLAEFKGLMLDFTETLFEGKRFMVINPLDFYHDKDHLEKYDMIICIDVLEHLFNPMAVITFLTSLLIKGGKLILKVSLCEGAGHCSKGIQIWANQGEAFLMGNYKKLGKYKFEKL